MNCPKCKHVISENDLVCPECGKILKLKCPQCSTVSKKNICPECGYILLTKCFKCGKLNPTTHSHCSKCGMGIVASMALKEATISTFAVLSIEIVNFEIIKKVFESRKTLKQFKDNFYSIIKNQAIDSKVRVQEIGNVLIIRFCRDEDFKASCMSAINFALNISQLIMEINNKLFKMKKVYLKIKFNVSKGDLSNHKTNYETGRNIDVIYGTDKINDLYKNIQILVDSYIYKVTKNKYSYQALSSVFIKNEMVTFYELVLNKVLQLPEEPDDIEQSNLPTINEFEIIEEEDNLPIIPLKEKKCSFIKIKPSELLDSIDKIVKTNVKNPIIVVKSNFHKGKLSNVTQQELSTVLPQISSSAFYCTPQEKLYPFGLFRNMIKSFYHINEFDLLFDESKAREHFLTANQQINDLLFLTRSKINNAEEIRFKVFEAITAFINAVSKPTIFVIEDFENIDDGSLDLLKYLIDTDSLGNIGFILSCDPDFYIHRHIYKLINKENFYELELKLAPNKEIVSSYGRRLKDIEKTFFFRKIIENMRGSKFYIEQALDYLTENKILINEKGVYLLNQNKMIVLPTTLNELIKKRLSVLTKEKNLFNVYTTLILLGGEVPEYINKLLDYDDFDNIVKTLESRNLVELTKDRIIKIKNYNLYRANLLEVIDKELLSSVALNICEKMINNGELIHPVFAECCEYYDSKKQAFYIWNNLAEIMLSLGDFSSYINCCSKYLSLIEAAEEEETEENKSVEVVKLEIYEQISKLLYRYYPEKIGSYLEQLIDNAEKNNDDKRVKNLSNIMVQSCLLSGNYKNALEYIGKVISRTPASSMDPSNQDFNLGYYLTNIVTVEIYFNLGKLEECIELGDAIFKSISNVDIRTILPPDFSPKRFKETLKETQVIVSIARIIQLKQNTLEKLQEQKNFYIGENLVFDVLASIYKLITGHITDFDKTIDKLSKNIEDSDSQTKTIYLIYKLLYFLQANQWENCANIAHLAKKFATDSNMHQMSLFLDLIIGYAYSKIGNCKKSNKIYYDVLKLSSEKGLTNISVLNWYLLAEIELDQNNPVTALGILNKAISNIEKDTRVSQLFTLSFKLLLAKVFLIQNEFEKAAYCAHHSLDIALKFSLKHKIPECSAVLITCYTNLINVEQDQSKVALYNEKISQIRNIVGVQ